MKSLCILFGGIVTCCSGVGAPEDQHAASSMRHSSTDVGVARIPSRSATGGATTVSSNIADLVQSAHTGGASSVDSTQLDASAVALDASAVALDASAADLDASAAQTDAATGDAGVSPNPNETSTSDASSATSDALIPSCPAHPTTSISIAVNLDAATTPPPNPWQPATSLTGSWNFEEEFNVYDGAGRAGGLGIYFANAGPGQWQYHAIIGGETSRIEVANGSLTFTPEGVLSHREVTASLRLPGPDGSFGSEIPLFMGTPLDEGGTGRDGITSYTTFSTVSGAKADGNVAALGVTCDELVDSQSPFGLAEPGTLLTPGAYCNAKPTSNWRIRANLCSISPIPTAWDRMRPLDSSNYHIGLAAVDALGRNAGVKLYFQKLSTGQWQYHALLEGDVPGIELGTGQLDFNANGSLHHVNVSKELRIPAPGSSPIVLDFGETTESGNVGVDGTTSFATGSSVTTVETDGIAGNLGFGCPSTPYVLIRDYSTAADPSWAAKLTTTIYSAGNLPPGVPPFAQTWSLTERTTISNASVYTHAIDSLGRPNEVGIYYLQIAPTVWEYHAVYESETMIVELGSGKLYFSDNGLFQRQEGVTQFRLPLTDGTATPLVDLDLTGSYGGTMTAFPGCLSCYPWVQNNGNPAPFDGDSAPVISE
jgi:hypothetical protein